MLKLEKSPKTHEITLSIREPNRFFTKTLLIALGWALALHLGGYLFIQIQPFKLLPSFTFPPVNVETTTPFDQLSLQIKSEEAFLDSIPPPPMPQAVFPLAPDTFLLDEESALGGYYKNLSSSFLFDSLERTALPILPPVSMPIEYTPLQIHVSGNLASRKILEEPDPIKKVAQGTLHYYRSSYDVQIDPLTGQIIWYEKKLSSGNERIDHLAENKLLSLKFLADRSQDNITGTIDFFVTEGKSDD